MSRKHDRTLESIFSKPPLAGVKWKDVENLLIYLGATVEEGRGSRIRVILNKEEAVFHRPHPRKEIDKGALVSIRRFLENAGERP